MPSLLRYAQGCGMTTDDKFLLVAVQVFAVLEFMLGGSYIQNLISFSYLVPGIFFLCDLAWSEPLRISFDLETVTVMV